VELSEQGVGRLFAISGSAFLALAGHAAAAAAAVAVPFPAPGHHVSLFLLTPPPPRKGLSCFLFVPVPFRVTQFPELRPVPDVCHFVVHPRAWRCCVLLPCVFIYPFLGFFKIVIAFRKLILLPSSGKRRLKEPNYLRLLVELV
jgi:hypothetical protein